MGKEKEGRRAGIESKRKEVWETGLKEIMGEKK